MYLAKLTLNQSCSLRAYHAQQMQLQEQRLRKDLTDGFQKTIEQVRKQCEECMENRLAMQKRVFEVEVEHDRS